MMVRLSSHLKLYENQGKQEKEAFKPMKIFDFK